MQDQLLSELQRHDDLYYNQDSPEISDTEYDAIKAKYVELYGEYNYVPGTAQFSKYEHQLPIRSLDKINSAEALRQQLARLAPGMVQYKYDGLTLVYYPNGRIVTRGNGLIGEDITDTARFMHLPPAPPKPVRMEAYLTKFDFAALNAQRLIDGLEPFKNARNAVAGILRNQHVFNARSVSYVAYEILGVTECYTKQIALMDAWGLHTPEWYPYKADSIDAAIAYIQRVDREALAFEIDGMVIKSDEDNSISKFGVTGHHPNNAIAFKFPSVGKWTTLRNVLWQVGRTGRVTPVAEFDPVEIGGSILSRATLNNIAYLNLLNVAINDEVFVVKANDVIPAITQVKKSNTTAAIIAPTTAIIAPTKCPVCQGVLTSDDTHLWCTNSACNAQLLHNTKHMAGRDYLNIEHLNEATIQKFIDEGMISAPWDVFDIPVHAIEMLPGFGTKSAKRLYDSIQAARHTEFSRLICAAGINLVGRSLARDIAQEFKNWDELINETDLAIRCRLLLLDGVGDTTVDSFMAGFDNLKALANKMIDIKGAPIKTVGPLTGKTFVVTGSFEHYKPRKKLEQLIVSLGGKLAAKVTPNVFALITNDVGSGSTKNNDAATHGVTIMTEAAFEDFIRR